MQQEAAKKLVRDTFEHAFDEPQFALFVRNFFNKIEPAEFPKPLSGQAISVEFRSFVESFNRIGKYTDAEGKRLEVLIVRLKSNTNLDRARSAQRNFVARHLKSSEQGQPKDAALVAFVSPDEQDWRFSFVRMDYRIGTSEGGKIKVEEELTPARRFSFLVGSNENSHTAQSRLLPILRNTDSSPTIDHIQAAFSVDAVTKEFFTEYRALFEKTHTTLNSNRAFRAMTEKQNIDLSSFAKKLLGQIVFLYFLQKKGWLGVPLNKAWGEGDKFFMRTLFARCQEKGENFYNDYLEILFYDTLNNPRSRQVDRNFSKHFGSKVPFLNGGLFEPDYDWENTVIHLDNELFAEILEVFDHYNFTVKEDEPLEKEVAVDPEMLGKVFENLLEENFRKGKGTYYTPREIVHFMCEQSLANYLSSKSGISFGKIESFLKSATVDGAELDAEVRDKKDAIDRLLREIKIVDPACGSGAFLVGMLQAIVRARLSLRPRISEYQLKKSAIQDSIYGVDVDPGAVDIAKLRLWLSLVVDFQLEDIEPLPNLDYKVMQGNSLLEEFEGIRFYDADSERSNGVLFADQERIAKKSELESKKHEYFSTSDDKAKAALRAEVSKLVDWFVKKSLDEEMRRIKKLRKIKEEEGKRLTAKHRAKYWDQWAGHFSKEGSIDELLKKIHDPKGERPFFLWKLNFMEVFNGHGGFDIAIANPPYIRQESISYKQSLNSYAVSSGTADIYCYFYELAHRVLSEKGTLAFITSNKYLRANYGKKLRQFLKSQLSLLTLIDFGDLPVFKATAYPSVLIADKAMPQGKTFKACSIESEEELSRFESVLTEKSIKMPQESLSDEDVWNIEQPETASLKRKIDGSHEDTRLLKDYVAGKIYYGVKTGYNEAFVIDAKTRDKLIAEDQTSVEVIKPYLRGRDIKRFTIETPGLFIIDIPNGWTDARRKDEKPEDFIKSTLPAISRHLSQFKKPLQDRDDQGRYWWELRPCKYEREFEKPKMVCPDIAREPRFAMDTNSHYLGNTGYIFGANDLYLLGVLNSNLIAWYYSQISSQIRGGFVRFIDTYLSRIPIRIPTDEQRESITCRVQQLLTAKTREQKTQALDKEIDNLVYDVYALSKDEIAIIEGNLSD